MNLDLPEELTGIAGVVGGALAIAATLYRNWKKEEREQAEARRASAAAVPLLMQQLAAVGTPMPALGIDATNDLHRALEIGTRATERLIEEMQRARVAGERERAEAGEAHREVTELLRAIRDRLVLDSEIEKATRR